MHAHRWRSFQKSFFHAFSGLKYALREERNFQIEFVIAIVVTMLSFLFPLSLVERSIIWLLIGSVLTLELFNTAFERMLDMLKPRIHPYVKVVKDIVAGAVLIGSIVSAIVWFIIFGPYIWELVRTL